MTLTPGYYRTRDGRKARVLCADAPGDYPFVGYTINKDGKTPYFWKTHGRIFTESESASDLIEPWTEPKPKTIKRILLRQALMIEVEGE